MDVFANELPQWSEHHVDFIGGALGLLGGKSGGGGSSSSTTTSNKGSYNTGVNGSQLNKILGQVSKASKAGQSSTQLIVLAAAVLGGIYLWRKRR